MIGRLTGILVEKNPPQILVDVQGVAYEVDVPMSTFYNLPATGERVALFTHLVVREDAHLLFGFGSEGERRAFRQLVRISGIGAGLATSVGVHRPPPAMNDVLNALTALGYSEKEAVAAVKKLPEGLAVGD